MNGIHEVTGSIPVWSTTPSHSLSRGGQTVLSGAASIPVSYSERFAFAGQCDPGLVYQPSLACHLRRATVAESRDGTLLAPYLPSIGSTVGTGSFLSGPTAFRPL